MVDELIYSELREELRRQPRRFAVRGLPRRGYGVVYPLLIAPAYALFERIPDAYAAVKTINSLVMSLAAVPAYFLARRVVGQGLALARRGARGRGAVDGLHGRGHDRERVLPPVPARRARARGAARAADGARATSPSSPRSRSPT